MASFFKEAASAYSPTDNSTELRKEASADRLIPEVHGLYAIEAVYPGMRLSDPERFKQIIAEKCPFITTHYPGVLKCWLRHPGEKKTFLTMIYALKQIEKGTLSQHEASQLIGSQLQQYIPAEADPAEELPGYVTPDTNISWAEWKRRNAGPRKNEA